MEEIVCLSKLEGCERIAYERRLKIDIEQQISQIVLDSNFNLRSSPGILYSCFIHPRIVSSGTLRPSAILAIGNPIS